MENVISKKIYESHKCQPNMKICSKFYPNRTVGKCLNSGRKVWGEGGVGISKKMQTSQCHPKINLYSKLKFHPNWTMGMCPRSVGKIGDGLTDVDNPRYSLKTQFATS